MPHHLDLYIDTRSPAHGLHPGAKLIALSGFVIAAMLRTIWYFNDYVVIQLLSGGGPIGSTEIPPILIYNVVFKTWNLGRGSAIAVIMFMVLLVMSGIYLRLYNWAQGELS